MVSVKYKKLCLTHIHTNTDMHAGMHTTHTHTHTHTRYKVTITANTYDYSYLNGLSREQILQIKDLLEEVLTAVRGHLVDAASDGLLEVKPILLEGGVLSGHEGLACLQCLTEHVLEGTERLQHRLGDGHCVCVWVFGGGGGLGSLYTLPVLSCVCVCVCACVCVHMHVLTSRGVSFTLSPLLLLSLLLCLLGFFGQFLQL